MIPQYRYIFTPPDTSWSKDWKSRLTTSKVLRQWKGSKRPKAETSKEYTHRRIKETTKQDKVDKALNTTADVLHKIGVGTTTIGLAGSLALAPAATVGAVAEGTIGSKLIDKAVQHYTGDNQTTWAKELNRKLGLRDNSMIGEILHPGMLIGGAVGARMTPTVVGKPIRAVDLSNNVDLSHITLKSPLMESLTIPKGYTFVREATLNGKLKHIVKDTNGKFKVLEDLNLNTIEQPKVNLKKYRGEKLTGNEEGFDQWARSLIPEEDHFANLSHGLNNENLLPIMNREFESLPNGSRVDLGEIFSSDSSSNLLQYVRRNHKRIKMVLPKNPDEVTVSNNYGTRGQDSQRIFNEQLDNLLDLYGYSPNAVPRAVYNPNTNTLTVPKLSFIKLYKKGNKIINNSLLKWK